MLVPQLAGLFLVKRAKIDLKNETYVKVAKKGSLFRVEQALLFLWFL